MAKFKFHVSTGYVGSECNEEVEIPDEEFEGMNEEEKEDCIQEWFSDWMWNHLDAGWAEI